MTNHYFRNLSRLFGVLVYTYTSSKYYNSPIFVQGRSKERDDIKELLHSIKADHTEGGRRVVIVEGEAGIGKTRLLEEFMDDAEEEDFK